MRCRHLREPGSDIPQLGDQRPRTGAKSKDGSRRVVKNASRLPADCAVVEQTQRDQIPSDWEESYRSGTFSLFVP